VVPVLGVRHQAAAVRRPCDPHPLLRQRLPHLAISAGSPKSATSTTTRPFSPQASVPSGPSRGRPSTGHARWPPSAALSAGGEGVRSLADPQQRGLPPLRRGAGGSRKRSAKSKLAGEWCPALAALMKSGRGHHEVRPAARSVSSWRSSARSSNPCRWAGRCKPFSFQAGQEIVTVHPRTAYARFPQFQTRNGPAETTARACRQRPPPVKKFVGGVNTAGVALPDRCPPGSYLQKSLPAHGIQKGQVPPGWQPRRFRSRGMRRLEGWCPRRP
jgi:hypothetical protein